MAFLEEQTVRAVELCGYLLMEATGGEAFCDPADHRTHARLVADAGAISLKITFHVFVKCLAQT